MNPTINFSPNPFVSATPRLIMLWVINGIVLIMIGLFIWQWDQLRRQNQHAHQSIQQVNDQERAARRSAQADLERLAIIDMKAHRKLVNQYGDIQMAFRAKWSILLDELSQQLNEDVRIVRIRSMHADRGKAATLPMELRAQARNKSAQLSFIKAMQDQPAFQHIRFTSEQYTNQQVIFDLSFAYRTEVTP